MLFTNLLNSFLKPFYSGMLEIIKLIALPIFLFIIFTIVSYIFIEIREKCRQLRKERVDKKKWGKQRKEKNKNKKSKVGKSPTNEEDKNVEVKSIEEVLIDETKKEYEGHPENYFNKGDLM